MLLLEENQCSESRRNLNTSKLVSRRFIVEILKSDERLEHIRRELDSIQTQLSICPTDLDLQAQEKCTIGSLRKFLAV